MRAGVCDVVDVEAGVDRESCRVDRVELVAGIILIGEGIWQDGEGTRWWWECQVGFKVGSVVAIIVAFMNGLRERLVEGEEVGPVIQVRHHGDWHV